MHKKYTFKNGKLYGPYFYENKRVGEKIVTTYVGKTVPTKQSFLPYLTLIAALLGIALIAFAFFSQPTGKAVLDIDSSYSVGEMLGGTLQLSLRSGELIPIDSIVRLSSGDDVVSLPLSELIDSDTINGSFFAEGVSLEGSGEGFGTIGTKAIYPTVIFELLIESSDSEASNNVLNESQEVEEGNENSNITVGEDEGQEGISEENQSESEPQLVEEEIVEDEIESPEDQEENVGMETTITGSIVSEGSFIIEGNVQKGSDFTYSLEEGQTASLVSGSVESQNVTLSDEIINVDVSALEVRVTTQYETEEQGFGGEFLGETAQTLAIDLSEFGLNVSSDRIVAELVYNDTIITNVETSIDLEDEGQEETNNETQITETVNDTSTENETQSNITDLTQIADMPLLRIAANGSAEIDLNDYFNGTETFIVEVSDINHSLSQGILSLVPPLGFSGSRTVTVVAISELENISDSFTVLVSSGALSITTLRSKIVVGEPVLWVKNITLDSPENITIELPAGADNITISAVSEERPAVAEIYDVEGNVITGSVTATLDVKKKTGISKWFRNMFSKITGRVVDTNETNLSNAEPLSVVLMDNATQYTIEYYTEAPTMNQTVLPDGEQIVVSGPDELNYTDVLATVELLNSIPTFERESIKLYWHNYDLPLSEKDLKTAMELENITIVEAIVSNDSNVTEFESLITGNAIQESDLINESVDSSQTYILQEMPFDIYDLDNNGEFDYMEWVVPHLSEQTFTITLVNANTSSTNITFTSNHVTLKVNNAAPYSNLALYLPADVANQSNQTPDLTGNGRISNLEMDNRVNLSRGLYGNAFLFNGSEDVNVVYDSTLEVASFTVSMWVNPVFGTTSEASGWGLVKSAGGNGWDHGWRINKGGNTDPTLYSRIVNSLGQATNLQFGQVSTNTWDHIVMTFDSSTGNHTTWKNGQAIQTATHSGGINYPNTDWMQIGSCTGCGNWQGYIDEFMLFNTSLSGAQIVDIYNNQSKRFSAQGLVEAKQFNITKGVDTIVNISIQNFRTEFDTNISVRVGRWDVSRGYNGTHANLVAYLHADVNATDSSGYWNNGSLSGTTYSGFGVYNDSFLFDGSNDFVNISSSSSLSLFGPAQQFTVCAWVYDTNSDSNFHTIIQIDNSSSYASSNAFTLAIDNFDRFEMRSFFSNSTGNPQNSDSDPVVYAANTWHFVCGVRANVTTASLYVNAVKKSPDLVAFVNITGPTYVKIGARSTTDPFKGSIDDVMIFNRTLSDDEIRELHAKGRANWDYTSYQNLMNITANKSLNIFEIYNKTTNVLPSFKLTSGSQFYTPYLASVNNTPINLSFTGSYITTCTTISTAGHYALAEDLTNADFMTNGQCIVLSASNSILDCRGHLIKNTTVTNGLGIWVQGSNNTVINCNTLLGGSNSDSFFVSGRNNTLINNTAFNGTTGLSIGSNAHNNTLINNTAHGLVWGSIVNGANNTFINNSAHSNTFVGIQLTSSSRGSTLIGNSFFNNTQTGIYLTTSHNSTFINNTVYENQRGFYLLSSNNSILRGNVALRNSYGFYIESSLNNSIINNTASNNSIYGIFLITIASNNNISNNFVDKNGRGIYIVSSTSTNNFISSNLVENNSLYGIQIASPLNLLVNNIVINSSLSGIFIEQPAYNNTLINNTVSKSDNNGITVQLSNNNTLINNTAFNNSYGISLSSAHNNSLLGNTAYNNTQAGIYLLGSQNNTVKNNTVFKNDLYGVYLASSSNYNKVIDLVTYNNSAHGVLTVTSAYNTIANVTAYNNTNGISVQSSTTNNVTSNKAFRNVNGIILTGSNLNILRDNIVYNNSVGINVPYYTNTLINNTANNNTDAGISVTAYNNTIINNTANNNANYGISLVGAANNTLRGNLVINNSIGGLYLEDSFNNTLFENIMHNQTNGAYLSSSSTYNNLSSNIANNNTHGIYIEDSNNNLLYNNTVSKGARGIYIFIGSNTEVLFNTVYNISNYAIWLTESSVDSNIINNTVYNSARGIYVRSSSNSKVVNNTAFNNTQYGIDVDESTDSIVSFNRAYNNTLAGISISTFSDGAIVINNSISRNGEGIYSIAQTGVIANNTIFENNNGTRLDDMSNNFFSNRVFDNLNYGVISSSGFDAGNNISLNTIYNHSKSGIFVTGATYTVLTSNNIYNSSEYGIFIKDSYYGNIMSNTLLDNEFGIYLSSSEENVINSNLVKTSSNDGILITGSSINNNLTNNNVSFNNEYGIHINQSSNSPVLKHNFVASNSHSNIFIENVDFGIFVNNTVSSSEGDSGFELFTARNNTFTNNTAKTNWLHGAFVRENSNNNTFINNNFSLNSILGLYIQSSHNNSVINNSFTLNGNRGFEIGANGGNNYILNNLASQNTQTGFAVFETSLENRFVNNTAISNMLHGFYLYDAHNQRILNATLVSNNHGISLDDEATNNTFFEILLNGTTDYAIYLISTRVDSNNFTNSTVINTFVDGYDLFVGAAGTDFNYFTNTPLNNYSIANSGGRLFFRNSSFGEIRFLSDINGTGNALYRAIKILNNSAYVNSSHIGLSKPANITFYNIPAHLGPGILRDGTRCPSAVCRNFTALTGAVVRFNVTGFSNYSIENVTVFSLTDCASGCLYVRNSSQSNKSIFDKNGFLDLAGNITQNSVGSPDGKDFVIKNSGGNVVAWVDDVTGSMRIAGNITLTQWSSCVAPSNSFIVKNSTGSCVAYIDNGGNLWTRGGISENAFR